MQNSVVCSLSSSQDAVKMAGVLQNLLGQLKLGTPIPLGEHAIRFSPQEKKLLRLLVNRLGVLVTKNELVKEIWGARAEVEDCISPLNALVYRTRQKLKSISNNSIELDSLYSEGYILRIFENVPESSLPTAKTKSPVPEQVFTWENTFTNGTKIASTSSNSKNAKVQVHSHTLYPPTYRVRETKIIAEWIQAGISGVVLGEKSARYDFLKFFCYAELPYNMFPPPPLIRIWVNLNTLPSYDPNTLYRTILRAFYEQPDSFNEALRQAVVGLYQKTEMAQDSFISQTALREFLLLLHSQFSKVVLILDDFDLFCRKAEPEIVRLLYYLHDEFKEILYYIVGSLTDITYLSSNPSMEPLRGILDMGVCYVGPLDQIDAHFMISHEIGEGISETEMTQLLALTGGYPSLIRMVCHWWKTAERWDKMAYWQHTLLSKPNMQHRLNKLWDGLTQEEQAVLSTLQKTQAVIRQSPTETKRILGHLERQRQDVLHRLWQKGMCRRNGQSWQIVGELFAAYIAAIEGRGYGRIWLDDETGDIYQGDQQIKGLNPLENFTLCFFINHPRIRHSHTSIIEACWSDDIFKEGVSTESLYQLISRIRKKIEPNPTTPSYIVNWRGTPEGGYQFFPEGKSA